jgi:phospho-N-acetylmuramoyl-pentapeptide-transferase
MLFLLVQQLQGWLEAVGLWKFLRVFKDVTFRAPMALVLSFAVCIVLGPRVIAWLRRRKIGDLARFDQAEVDKLLSGKSGTPTMGGILIVSAIAGSTLLLGNLSNFYVTMALVCLLWLAAVGAADDWLKLTAARRSGGRQGLHTWEKLLFQLGLGVILSYFTYRHGGQWAQTHTLYFPFFKDVTLGLSLPAFVFLGTTVLVGTSNAVNLSDGLDGLAAGCSAIVGFTLFILAVVVGHFPLARYLNLTYILPAGEMAVLAGAITGACLGFLWFNCHPARVFMGDTGSLALGGLTAYIAIVLRQELLLLLLGGVFVAEALSVLIQVGYFKYSRRRYGEGRRVFLMAPLHLHFIRRGWVETQVVVRFWLIGALLAALTLASVKLR